MMNFTASDLIGSVLGVLLFLPLMTAPGYVAGWAGNTLGFRALAFPWRILIAVPLSMALCPIVSYYLGSLFGWAAVWVLYALSVVLAVILLSGRLGHEKAGKWISDLSKTPRTAFVVAAIWLAVAVLSLVDLQIGNRLYYSATVYDHSVRTAITDAITRTGIRPENPFYFLGSPAPLRYHYFWFIACSLVQRLGGQLVNPRQAIIASVVWSGWGFAALVPLFLRFLFGMTDVALRRTAVIALSLTAVTGLDIVPTLLYWTRGIVFADMEWWNDQITSWWGTGLWVPHHLAALVIGLAALLLIWSAALEANRRFRIAQAILAGVALASMVGTSIYVAFVFAVFLSIWTVATWLLRERQHAAVLLLAGCFTAIVVAPYLLSLTHLSAGSGASQSAWFFKPYVRHFGPFEDWPYGHPASQLVLGGLRLAFLPLNYFLELGVFLVGASAFLIRCPKTRTWGLPLFFLAALAGTSVLICTFLRSAVIRNNDLGCRGFLPAQFVFLLWTATVLTTFKRADRPRTASSWLRSPLWAPLILLGVAGTLYEITLLRFEGLLADKGMVPLYFSPDHQLGRRTYEVRRAYSALKSMLPSNAIIQNNPQWKYLDYFYGLYADRQTAAHDPTCGADFGGSEAMCKKFYPEIASVFSNSTSLSADQVWSVSKQFDLDAVLVKDLDESWKDHESWVWKTAPAIANDYVRIYFFPGKTLRASTEGRHAEDAPL